MDVVAFQNVFFTRKCIKIIFFLFFKNYFWHSHIKIIWKYKKILIWSKKKIKTFKFFLKHKNKHYRFIECFYLLLFVKHWNHLLWCSVNKYITGLWFYHLIQYRWHLSIKALFLERVPTNIDSFSELRFDNTKFGFVFLISCSITAPAAARYMDPVHNTSIDNRGVLTFIKQATCL
jgi:hypothetical protein